MRGEAGGAAGPGCSQQWVHLGRILMGVALESGDEPALATVITEAALALRTLSGSQTSDQLAVLSTEGALFP